MTGLLKKVGLGIALAAAVTTAPASAQRLEFRWDGYYAQSRPSYYDEPARHCWFERHYDPYVGYGERVRVCHYAQPRPYYYGGPRRHCWFERRYDPDDDYSRPVRVCHYALSQ